jgi:ABC-type transport system involved in multi-copper enzyme maturation permease subunit
MSLASTYIGWSAQHAVTSIYSASAMQLQSEGSPVPPSPFADLPHLFLLKNMIIYVVLIGALLAINIGHSAGMRERKAGVVKILFSRPVQKRDFIIGKILGISLVLMAIMILAAIVSIVSTFFLASLTFHDIVGIMNLIFHLE